jgi:hypothetical protein
MCQGTAENAFNFVKNAYTPYAVEEKQLRRDNTGPITCTISHFGLPFAVVPPTTLPIVNVPKVFLLEPADNRLMWQIRTGETDYDWLIFKDGVPISNPQITTSNTYRYLQVTDLNANCMCVISLFGMN